jgi:hypothetical protein
MNDFGLKKNKMESANLHPQHLHILVLGLCDNLLSLNSKNKPNNKSKAEAYLLFSYFMEDRLALHFNQDISTPLENLKSIGLQYLNSLNVNLNSLSQVISLIEVRKEIFKNIDAKKQESIVDIMGPQVRYLKITPKEKVRNPDYDKVKDNPVYQLIVGSMKYWYHTIRGIDKNEYVNDYDYEKWIHFCSQAFGQLAYLIYENPLSNRIGTSNDQEFIYSTFGNAVAISIRTIDKYCEKIGNA